MLGHPAIESSASHAQLFGGATHIETVPLQGSLDEVPFGARQGRLGVGPYALGKRRLHTCSAKLQILDSDFCSVGQNYGALQSLLQSPHVSRPGGDRDQVPRDLGQSPGRPIIALGVEAQKVVGQSRDVVAPFPQWRGDDFHRVQLIEQSRAQPTRTDGVRSQLSGRGDEPNLVVVGCSLARL